MTTPQNELYNLSYKVKELISMFKVDEGEATIFEDVKQLYTGHADVVKRLDIMQDQMALIIKLLSKDETKEIYREPVL